MQQLKEYFLQIIEENARKIILSKPAIKDQDIVKIIIEKKSGYYQAARYTRTQVFHENITPDNIVLSCADMTHGSFLQVNAWTSEWEYYILISKKGNAAMKRKRLNAQNHSDKVSSVDPNCNSCDNNHNRRKNYILQEGKAIPPLVDMGIFTKEGKVVRSMYDKFRQINRFIEMIDDAVKTSSTPTLNVIDFGCGKSYLTFVLYYYLTEIKKIDARIIGLDLKEDVIKHCNEVAEKYDYKGLHFELGDINGYQTPFDVDMVVTLHACDTATDYALYNAITWNARMIFSVPCCQHELNSQIRTETFRALTDYGILKERFCALATDAVRGKLLEYCGYKTQLLEFIDFDHTPKNILIRAVKRPMGPKHARENALKEAEALCREFQFHPTLYALIKKESRL